tara:strand:+ start:141 stop:830 length:690 start_codon:yes stop_codon:yes gene_type:complete
MLIKKDNFVESLLGINSYLITTNKRTEKKFDRLQRIVSPSFITLKSKFLISKLLKEKIKASLICKQITFKKKYKKNSDNTKNCRLVRKFDLKPLRNISLENSSNSHFVQDKRLPYNFRKKFRFNWLNNFFKKKRGDLLVVYEKKNIFGFIMLIIKKNTYVIDLIVTSKKKRKLGVARSLINFINNNYLKKKKSSIIAGTQSNNLSAIKLYNKMGFKKIREEYVYHIIKN